MHPIIYLAIAFDRDSSFLCCSMEELLKVKVAENPSACVKDEINEGACRENEDMELISGKCYKMQH